jgi:hypothetical protein
MSMKNSSDTIGSLVLEPLRHRVPQMEVCAQRNELVTLPWGKNMVHTEQEAGVGPRASLDGFGEEKPLGPAGIWTLDHLAYSESLY